MFKTSLVAFAVVASTTVAAPVVTQAAAPAVTLTASSALVEKGDTLTLSGNASRAKPGTKVAIERRASKTSPWRVVGSTTVKKKQGRFVFRSKAKGTKRWSYRATVGASATSKQVKVAIARWVPVTKVEQLSGATLGMGNHVVGSKRYGKSLRSGLVGVTSTAYADMYVAKRCYALRTHLGLGDMSGKKAGSLFVIRRDGALAFTQTVRTTEGIGALVTVDIAGTNVLRLETERVGSFEAWPGFASPKFLCTN